MNHLDHGGPSSTAESTHDMQAQDAGFVDWVLPLARHWRSLLAVPVLAGALAWGGSFLITPTFTASTTFLPPQQQSSAASALASLGAIASLAGAGTVRTAADQYVALMQSVTVSDRLIDEFKLMDVYGVELRELARKKLAKNVSITVGKKDGLIYVEVDDAEPLRAAKIANAYVDQLRRLTASLAVTEAQQRRVFFEKQLLVTRNRLTEAQRTLQDGGINPGTLKSEPKAAAEQYARLKAELTAAEVRLQVMRGSLAEGAPEVVNQTAQVRALRSHLLSIERDGSAGEAPTQTDYVSRYREFKYQETLFDLMSRQYELAKVDEAREGALIQVVDPALAPERKSKPRRAVIALGAALAGFLSYAMGLIVRQRLREAAGDPDKARGLQRLREALHR